MNISVICIGKLKERFWVDACAEYLKRLKAYAKVSVVELSDCDPTKVGGVQASKEKEADAILAAIPDKARVFLLAIEGKLLSSEELAEKIDAAALNGNSDLVFIIGGSCGVSDRVYARAHEKLSFGRITLPHNLARVVLLEQLYRSFKILRGEPYHK